MKILCALAAVLMLSVPSAFCDEPQEKGAASESRQSVEVQVTQSTTQSGSDTEAETKVNGRIVITGPDGQQREYSIGEGGAVVVDESGNLLLKEGATDSPAATASDDSQPRFMIGVACEPAGEVLRRHLKLKGAGLVVIRVSEGLPAAEAGIQPHDILLSSGDTGFMELQDLVDVVSAAQQNPLQVTLLRDGEQKTLTVTPRSMTAAEARKAMGLEESVIGVAPPIHSGDPADSWRNLVFGPGIRLEQGGDAELKKIISEAQALARKHFGHGSAAVSTEKDLRRRMQELQNQVEQLAKRLEAVEKQ